MAGFPVAADRMARFLDWQREVGTDAGRDQFLQELVVHPDLNGYAKAKNLPAGRITAYLVAHPELGAAAKSAIEWFVHQSAVEVVELADDLVDEAITEEQRARLDKAIAHRTAGRKWLTSKWLRGVYGESVEHTGKITLTHEQQLEQLK
jgi:hypothetical protein